MSDRDMSSAVHTLGSLGAAALRVRSGTITLEEALAPGNNLSDTAVTLVLSYLDKALENSDEDLETAYIAGELMLASIKPSATAETKGLLAMKITIVISLLRPGDSGRQRRRIDLQQQALHEFVIAGLQKMLPHLLYNIGNAYRDALTLDPAVRLRNAIAYYDSALLLAEDEVAVKTPIIQNLGACHLERTDNNRLALLSEALSFFKHAMTLLPTPKDDVRDEEADYAALQINMGLWRGQHRIHPEGRAGENQPGLACNPRLLRERSRSNMASVRFVKLSPTMID
jgi:tetratricopeptide (TPR) repeat protein